MEQNPSWDTHVNQLVKKFSTFYETWNFTTAFTKAHPGPYAKQDESSPHYHTLFP
jgi:hypothetical protein